MRVAPHQSEGKGEPKKKKSHLRTRTGVTSKPTKLARCKGMIQLPTCQLTNRGGGEVYLFCVRSNQESGKGLAERRKKQALQIKEARGHERGKATAQQAAQGGGTEERRKKGPPYPVGSASTKVSSILSLLPPSEARPACISTTMASTTCRRRAGGVAQPSSNSLSSATARRQRARADALRATSTAAIAHVAAAQPAATPSPTLPIPHAARPPPPPAGNARGGDHGIPGARAPAPSPGAANPNARPGRGVRPAARDGMANGTGWNRERRGGEGRLVGKGERE